MYPVDNDSITTHCLQGGLELLHVVVTNKEWVSKHSTDTTEPKPEVQTRSGLYLENGTGSDFLVIDGPHLRRVPRPAITFTSSVRCVCQF